MNVQDLCIVEPPVYKILHNSNNFFQDILLISLLKHTPDQIAKRSKRSHETVDGGLKIVHTGLNKTGNKIESRSRETALLA